MGRSAQPLLLSLHDEDLLFSRVFSDEISGVMISLETEPLAEPSLPSHLHWSCSAVSPLCHAAHVRPLPAVAAHREHSGCSSPSEPTQARVP